MFFYCITMDCVFTSSQRIYGWQHCWLPVVNELRHCLGLPLQQCNATTAAWKTSTNENLRNTLETNVSDIIFKPAKQRCQQNSNKYYLLHATMQCNNWEMEDLSKDKNWEEMFLICCLDGDPSLGYAFSPLLKRGIRDFPADKNSYFKLVHCSLNFGLKPKIKPIWGPVQTFHQSIVCDDCFTMQ